MRDVVVVGLGAMGAAALWQLARRGVDVLGIDQHTPPHAFGSSHGHSRVFRTAYFEHPSYVPLLQRASALWTELEKEAGSSLFRRTGCLTIGPPEHELIVGVRASVSKYRLAHEEFDAAGIRSRFPSLNPSPDDVAVYEADAGLLVPETCIATMLDCAKAQGAEVLCTRVQSIDVESTGVRVRLGDGESLRAKRVVVAIGAWLGAGVIDYRAPLTVMRQVQHWFRPNSAELETLPCFIHVDADRAYYGLPPHAGRGMKVCRHYGGELVEPDDPKRERRAEDEADVRRWLRDHLPSADGPLEDAIVCMYGLSPDRHFIVGAHPLHERVLLAGGFSGHGFKMAPVIGEVLAELAVDGSTRQDIGLFDPGRFGNEMVSWCST